ncbi:MAG TPA: nuclear transport factor 2 family protein [Myxococcota bacterium]|nr:nuclear transport factor 2 family protein [Myxococcota bacterium]
MSGGVLISLFCLAAPAGAAEAQRDAPSQLVAMASRMIAAANAGDAKAMASMVADGDHAIIDNFPPFIWTGSNALSSWLDDLARNSEERGMTDPKSRLGATKFIRIEGDRAYVTVEDHFAYKRKGRAVREDLLWTFVATQASGDWKLVSWSFSGGAKH